jgi:gliding motility-associated-like protein
VDQDGDLDLVQLNSGTETTIRWFENTTASENNGPGKFNAVVLPVFDRVLLYWDVPSDDHTAGESLTYDVYLEGATMGRDVSFDLENGKRIKSVHGNNGTNNFLLLKNRGESFNYAIQAVDNSLFASPDGICFGNSVPCAEQNHEVTAVCATESVELSAPVNALWFSFSKGFLGAHTSYTYDPQSMDTVFYVIPTGECPLVMTFEFKTKDAIRHLEPETRFACKNADISLAAYDALADIKWSSQENGVVGTSPNITFKAESDDIITLAYTDKMECAVEKEFAIELSLPMVTAAPLSHRIMRGQSVQLNAAGAENYTWSPSDGLNNNGISNPVASPLSDTRYTVTGTDSIGCTATATVDILVESNGFIPSLFTPNGDGQNDLLRVYGISTVDNFSLQIVNREGSVVFSTSSIAEAAGQGWDGETNGIEQPNGVYFWKVEGQSASGNTILLNGKDEGSLVLLR